MNPTILRILFVLFLLAHGWIHMSLARVPAPQPGALHTPFFPSWWRSAVDASWPVSKLGLAPEVTRALGWGLWLIVTVLYCLAGAALAFAPAHPALWQGLTVCASLLSLLLLGLYWHPWLPMGVLIDLALIAAVWLHWPVLTFAKGPF